MPDLFRSEQVITCRDDDLGLRAVIAVDDTTLGPGFGGVRWATYPSTEAAVAEAQRLAQAMTLKHALAGLPYGGAKSVVLASGPLPADGSAQRRALMARYGEFIARTAGTYIPGVDMGTTLDDMQTIRDAGARAFCADVDPGPYTAAGVYAAMRAGVAHVLDREMAGVRVLVQGAGHVGAHLARYAARDGADVLVADVDTDRAAAVAEEVGGQVADAGAVVRAECDVLAPCAVARVLRADEVEHVRARLVCGAANDTLDSPYVAELLRLRGITFVPDFVANAGGVIQVHADEVGWSRHELDQRIASIGDLVGRVLQDAARHGRTPVEAALRIAGERLGGPRQDPPDLLARTRHYYERVDAGDVEGVLDWFAPDAVYERPGYAPMRGRQALAAFYGGERVIDSGVHTLQDVIVEGGRVAVRGRFDGTLKDGSSVSIGFADVIEYDPDGRAVRRHSYFESPAV